MMLNGARSIVCETQLRRESAYLWGGRTCGFATGSECGSLGHAAGRPSKRPAALCQHRYPSPDRSALSQGRPVILFQRSDSGGLIGGKPTVIEYQGPRPIVFARWRTNSGAALKSMLGKQTCKRHPSSLPQWRPLALLAAWTPTWNAAPLAQVQALSLPKRWAPIRQARRWPVLPLAFCVTTQASAAAHVAKTFAFSKAFDHCSRRRGMTPAAVSRSGEGY